MKFMNVPFLAFTNICLSSHISLFLSPSIKTSWKIPTWRLIMFPVLTETGISLITPSVNPVVRPTLNIRLDALSSIFSFKPERRILGILQTLNELFLIASLLGFNPRLSGSTRAMAASTPYLY
ncbi:hypothetical protein GLOIN_2v1641915 [Rhizophagus irregularis DAOM 181602=DAOM 197198]|uniref:Uncharacterized protein n=1 Tax=Rhizophagus irregularis (strain DAOM 181602 / DAOM 197198 / MUCL 43194) TaxID=747089 RepID=A0A2P4PRH6_RHIID|nr:hypothetical protein GLOIN_2v1641915 [Rhizophagus irregularis DAOM 181602=DAOM 197198]POG67977.1 hypothetical protein GLOIN_2v1641915 [Rhizophagus irregularis DAOM 181602=DAOM 197198]|eukprot:XP_025174843.1 hypothetical protein GLOIN_2v1641915 [Rhizophagus irregularis DAOM 181602=DAOM 197198]